MNQSPEVEAWLEHYDNPMKNVVRLVRGIILHADPRIGESIEGEAPTFSYRGKLASFFPGSKKHASVMFPRGAEIPGHHPRLEGSGETTRVMKIGSEAEAHAAKQDLQHLVRSWCDWREADREASAEPKARARRKVAAKTAKAPRKKRVPAAAGKARTPRKKSMRPATTKAKSPRRKAARPTAKKVKKAHARA